MSHKIFKRKKVEMTKSNTRVKNFTSEWNQKYQHFLPNAYRSLLYIQFVAVAFQTTQKPKNQYKYAGVLKYFIPTKFGKYPSSDSVVKADSVFQYIYMN